MNDIYRTITLPLNLYIIGLQEHTHARAHTHTRARTHTHTHKHTHAHTLSRSSVTHLHDSLPDFPVTPISPTTSRNISIGFQSLLALNVKFCLLFSKPKWGWHLNISVTPSDFRPLPHPFVLYAPWTGGSCFFLRTRTTMAMSRSLAVIAPSLWNRLPPSAHASLLSSNLSTSLSLLKTCLFSWS